MTKWRIKYEQIYVRPEGYWSHKAWSLYYGKKRVARYTQWELCCEHAQAAHERFGL